MTKTYQMLAMVMALCVASAGTAMAESLEKLQEQEKEALQMLNAKDSTFDAALKKAYGHVIFPNVGKGGFIVGGAGGEGLVYEGTKLIGTATLSQATIGAQVGGQTFIEVILFSDQIAMRKFKEGRFEMSAGVSAVAAAEGVADKADYEGGMAVITLPKKGLMAEASVGGQKFKFVELPETKK
ncbi:MAG: hypothetical protein MUC91_06555 [Verrucomicrobia bacterium]|jgi:lipid-binding SYLF domain-containing protein|nr:hypothetical protein [Verrucomicrobiota bacterium]